MSYGSRRSTKDKPVAPQGPDGPAVFVTPQSLRSRSAPGDMPQRTPSPARHAGRPAPQGPWRPPVSGNARSAAADRLDAAAAKDYSSPDGLRHLPTSDGLTVLMPAVQGADVTVVMPAVSARSRHVLDELAADVPDLVAHEDPGPEVAGSLDRAINGMATNPDPDLRRQAMAVAVRWFRAARDMARKRERWCDEADRRLRIQQARLAEFNASWDERLHAMNMEACGQRITNAGYGMAACYADEGTAVTLGMADEIRRMIVADSLTKAGVSE